TPLGFSFPYGKYGVQLFFMLSGFVNAMTLLRKKKPGQFLSSRIIRIFPVYWLVVLLNLTLLSTFVMYGQSTTPEATLANLTAMPRLFGVENWEPVTWTLQIELLFYGILLILFRGGAFINTARSMLLLLGISLLGVPLVEQLQINLPDTLICQLAMFLSDLLILKHLPLFVIGISLHEIWSRRGKVIDNGLVILTATFVFHSVDRHDHNPAITLFFIGLLTLSAYGKLPVLRLKPLMFLSGISYSLYLFHNNLGCLVIRSLNDLGLSPLLSILVATAFTIGIAMALTKYFEQPLTQYLKRKIEMNGSQPCFNYSTVSNKA
ncbi:MAG: acyltransferase, partial [Planctomycetota bacterium]